MRMTKMRGMSWTTGRGDITVVRGRRGGGYSSTTRLSEIYSVLHEPIKRTAKVPLISEPVSVYTV
ncbi:hypothetical protein RSAG8_10299, partial [Rhizoctonia solani AG-8 WAC10335]